MRRLFQMVQEPLAASVADDADADFEPALSRVTTEEAFNGYKVALRFVKQSSDTTLADVLLLKRWRDKAACKRSGKKSR
ncbi:hypothetical protein J6590_011720 [Homalodisca vitripennis]|nr:hypothetical protein J6590_011720 [Homalodisca vitripennis]